MSPARLAVVELLCTVVLPLLILQLGSAWVGPLGVVLWAAAPAVVFLTAQMVRDRTVSALGVLSLVGVGLTSAVGFLELGPRWFALKEALLPAAIALVMAATARGPWPLVGVVLERVFDRAALAAARAAPEAGARYDVAVRRATLELAVATALPGLGAWVLATVMVTAPSGTEAWVAEVAKYNLWSLPAVTVPAGLLTLFVFRRVFDSVERALGVELETLLVDLTA